VEYTGSDLLARAFCHELDHLDGKLYTDCAIRMLTDND
jgi:peptide deformylase